GSCRPVCPSRASTGGIARSSAAAAPQRFIACRRPAGPVDRVRGPLLGFARTAHLTIRTLRRARYRSAFFRQDATLRTPRRPSTRVGIKDIAHRLGVSIGTVDRALNGKRGVSRATKARVLAVAKELAYEPNLAARSLQSGRRL